MRWRPFSSLTDRPLLSFFLATAHPATTLDPADPLLQHGVVPVMPEDRTTRGLGFRLGRFANLIAVALCVGVFLLFSSGAVVPLHEGGWIQNYVSFPATVLCILVNLPLGFVVWLVTRNNRSAAALRYVGLTIACLSVVGLLVLCLLLY